MDPYLEAVIAEASVVAERFVAAGHRIHLVGGIVRDLHLGVPLEALDFDLTTDARPDRIKAIVGPIADDLWAQGERFGTIGCRIAGRDYEITTHRAEWYETDTRKPDVAFGDDIDGDLSRRDFTINAMAIELPGAQRIDPFGGIDDLEAGILRTPIDPAVSFGDDPLRILRGARFVARYDLSVDPAVERAAADLAERMSIISVERIREELDKLLGAPDPTPGLRFLDRCGVLANVFGPTSGVDVDALGAMLGRAPIDLELRRLVVHSIGEPPERVARLDRLRYSTAEQRSIRTLIEAADGVLGWDTEWTDESIRRVVFAVGFDATDVLVRLVEVRGGDDRFAASLKNLGQREDLEDLGPVLDGGQIMELLALDPGPAVGAAVARLQERRLRDGPATAEEESAWLLADDHA